MGWDVSDRGVRRWLVNQSNQSTGTPPLRVPQLVGVDAVIRCHPTVEQALYP